MAMDAITKGAAAYQVSSSPVQKTDTNVTPAQESNAIVTHNTGTILTPDNLGGNTEDNEKAEKQRLVNAIEDANKKLDQIGSAWEFTYQLQTKRVAIQLVDRETKEIIREIPSEEHQLMMEKLWKMTGILVDEKL